MRQLLALDLKDDSALIEAYELHHRKIWPEIAERLRRNGVTTMEIHRLGNRLVMLMETDDAVFDASRFDAEQAADPINQRWEALMDTYQQATPWSLPGRKWTPLTQIFDLADQ